MREALADLLAALANPLPLEPRAITRQRAWFKTLWRQYWLDFSDPWERRVPFDSEWPSGAAVYFLFVGDELVYVGQSLNIKDRFLGHVKVGTIFPTHFSFIDVDPFWLEEVERYYIKRYLPKHNKMTPPCQFMEKFAEELHASE